MILQTVNGIKLMQVFVYALVGKISVLGCSLEAHLKVFNLEYLYLSNFSHLSNLRVVENAKSLHHLYGMPNNIHKCYYFIVCL